MGNLCFDCKKLCIKQQIVYGEGRLKFFIFLKQIQCNKISCVWLFQHKTYKTFFAVKITKKLEASRKNIIHLPINQQYILGKIKHSLIVNMVEAFQDMKNLYLILEYMPYGSLRDYINEYGYLTQSQTRFVMICLLIAVDYLHKQKIAHLDIKPQNLLIDKQGYFRLSDFNLSMDCKKTQKKDGKIKLTGIGTYGYQAPQIYQNASLIGLQSDLYSIGVLCAQLLTGICKRNSQIFCQSYLKNILRERVNISNNCIDFICKLLQQNPTKRLGARDNFQQIWKHPWLQISHAQRLQYIIKQVPSFVHYQYRKNRQIYEKQPNFTDIRDNDQLLDRTLMQNLKFQKQFSQFRNVEYRLMVMA